MKLNPPQSRQQQPGPRSRAALVSVDRLLMQPEVPEADLFKSVAPRRRGEFASVDALVVSGNQSVDELDNLDFAGFRNDKELASKMLKEARRELKKLHPEGEGEAFQRDLRRVLHARYLQGHGI